MEGYTSVKKTGEFEIRDIFAIIANNLIKIILVALVFGVVTYFYTNNYVETIYQADATVALQITASSKANNTGLTYSETQQLVETFSIILKSDELINLVDENLGLNIDTQNLMNKITTSGVKSTLIMDISVKDTNQNDSVRIANEIIKVGPSIINENYEGTRLVAVNRAKEGVPVYPSVPLNTLIALFLGAALVICIEILKEYLDDTIKSDEQIRQMFGIPVIGLLPEINNDNNEINDESKNSKHKKNEDKNKGGAGK